MEVRLGGRIYTKRASGSKLVFYDVRSEGMTKTVPGKLRLAYIEKRCESSGHVSSARSRGRVRTDS